MIKNLHVITRLDMGGSAQNTLLTCLGLSKMNYEVILAHGLSLESQMTPSEQQLVAKQIENAAHNGLRVVSAPSLVRKIDPVQDIQTFWSLYRLMLTERPTIVHTHTSKAGILGRLAAKLAAVPFIVHTFHGHVFYGHFGPLTTRFFILLETFFALLTDKMVALTEEEKKDYIRYAVCRPDKITTIHSGVEIHRFLKVKIDTLDKKDQLNLNPQKQVVGTVGWLLPIKGPMILLKAMGHVWQSNAEVELVFVGKGALEADLKKEVSRMGVSGKVKFLGWREDIHEILPLFDIFVLPSLNEGMGRVLVEAMAAARPIVASRSGGIPDLVKHQENGLLVPPGDDISLADAILNLLDDPQKAGAMGQTGKIRCQDFTAEAMVEKIDALYRTLLNGGFKA
ncbi:MAG: glycosyltransferase family 4 protein [Desulfobacterales bacterium]|jgi:glycosyltransferase involved in cell wall biosynthesis